MAEAQKRPREDAGPGGPDAKRQAPSTGAETVFRLLVPARKVGSVIGKGGQIVKQIREDTNSKVRVVEGVPNCEDRVIVISSRDTDPAIETNSAQTALLKVHERAIEGEEPSATGGHSPSLMARLLVCHTQAGSIIGKAGKIIKEIREASGAQIKILPETDLPLCGLSNDRVVQVIGDPPSIERALLLVSKQIRDNPPKERPGGAPACLMAMLAGGAPPAGQSYQGHAIAAGGAPPYRPQYR